MQDDKIIQKTINTVRALSMNAVHAAKSRTHRAGITGLDNLEPREALCSARLNLAGQRALKK